MIKKKVKHLLANKDKAIQYPLVNDVAASSLNTETGNEGDGSDSDDVGNEDNSAVCNIS